MHRLSTSESALRSQAIPQPADGKGALHGPLTTNQLIPTFVSTKSQLPREAVWLLGFEVGWKWADQVAGLFDGVRADRAENRIWIALYKIDVGYSAVGIHLESNYHAIQARHLCHCLLNFHIPA